MDQLPCSPEVFKTWSGGSGYGLFDQDLTPGGLRELDRKLSLMGPEVKMWRHMAVFGSLAPGGAIAFDKNDMPLGFADPSTGRMGKNQFDKLPIVLKRIDQMLSLLKKHDKKMTFVFLAHDFADGMKKKENRLEGDRPSLFTDSKKFAKFLELQRPVLEHISANWRDVVEVVELINEPLNMETTLVPIPFIQQCVHKFNLLVHEVDPTMLVSVGMRDTKSWGYFAHMTLPRFKFNGEEVENPYYQQFIPQSHWYADKEEDTPIGTNVGTFFMPSYTMGWLKGELDPREPTEYIAAFGVPLMLEKVYKAGYMGALFWMDREGEFWPNWRHFSDFMRNKLPKRAPFTRPNKLRKNNGFGMVDPVGFLAAGGMLALGGVAGKIGLALSVIVAGAIIISVVNRITTPKARSEKSGKTGMSGDKGGDAVVLPKDEDPKSKKIIPKDEKTDLPVESVARGEERGQQIDPVLIEADELSVNNRLTKMINAGNRIVEYYTAQPNVFLETYPDRESTAFEIKMSLKNILEKVSRLDNIPKNVEKDISLIRKNIEHLEVDGIVAAIITVARRVKAREQILIGLETDWIPDYAEKGMQRDVVRGYIRDIGRIIKNELKRMGLDGKVIFVHESREKLASELLSIKGNVKTNISDVVVLASNGTIMEYSKEFDKLGKNGKRPFLAKIDPSDIEVKSIDHKVYTTKIMEMLSITLELAVSGRDSLKSNLSMIKAYDPVLRIIEFMPNIRRVDYSECIEEYKCKLKALQAA